MGNYTYVNSFCEVVLKGLLNGKIYLQSRDKDKNKFNLFEIYQFDTDALDSSTLKDSFAIANGVMHEDFDKWFFYLPDSQSGPEALRFNESIFIGRALGITMSSNFDVSGNYMYSSAARNYTSDAFTRDEVYAVTAVRSELTPYSMEEIRHYLGINSYRNDANDIGGSNKFGGDSSNTP
jgi:hypothetical protein